MAAEWHDGAIAKCKSQLLDQLDEVSVMHNLLASNTFDLSDQQTISSQPTSVDRRLLILERARLKRCWSQFISALEHSKQQHLVAALQEQVSYEYISAAISDGLLPNCKQLQSQLEDYIDTECENIRIYWNEFLDFTQIDEAFFDLQLVGGGKRQTAFHDFSFVANKSYRIIVVEGDPGIGKTTYVNCLAKRWAKGDITLRTMFDFLFLIKLEQVQIDQLVQVALQQFCLQNEGVLPQTLNNKRTLLIFDGMDELNVEKFPNMFALISGRTYTPSKILVTTRSSHINLLSRRDCWIRVNGFSRETLLAYCKLQLHNRNGEQISDIMYSNLLKVPIYAAMYCVAIKNNQTIELQHAGADFQLIKSFINCLLMHGATVKGLEESLVDSVAAVAAAFALHTLPESEKSVFNVNSQVLTKYLGQNSITSSFELACQIGLLVGRKQRNIETFQLEQKYTFAHSILQRYLAAMSLARNNLLSQFDLSTWPLALFQSLVADNGASVKFSRTLIGSQFSLSNALTDRLKELKVDNEGIRLDYELQVLYFLVGMSPAHLHQLLNRAVPFSTVLPRIPYSLTELIVDITRNQTMRLHLFCWRLQFDDAIEPLTKFNSVHYNACGIAAQVTKNAKFDIASRIKSEEISFSSMPVPPAMFLLISLAPKLQRLFYSECFIAETSTCAIVELAKTLIANNMKSNVFPKLKRLKIVDWDEELLKFFAFAFEHGTGMQKNLQTIELKCDVPHDSYEVLRRFLTSTLLLTNLKNIFVYCDQLLADHLLCKVVQNTDCFTIKFSTQNCETTISSLEKMASQIGSGLTACIGERFTLIVNGFYSVNSCKTMEAKLSVFWLHAALAIAECGHSYNVSDSDIAVSKERVCMDVFGTRSPSCDQLLGEMHSIYCIVSYPSNKNQDAVSIESLEAMLEKHHGDPPLYPMLADYEERLHQFQTWPKNEILPAEKLAHAGFFYMGYDDSVQCFCCGLILNEWEPEDDPLLGHAKFSPDCLFLKKPTVNQHISD